MRNIRTCLLAIAAAILAGPATAQSINDVQLRPGSSALWGAALNVTGSNDVSLYNTAGTADNSFRFFQGTSPGSATQLLTLAPTGSVFGAATGGAQGPGTINATAFYQNGVAFGGITQLTGDVLAGPGSGSQVATLATVNTNTGTWGSATLCAAFTTNGKGLITAAAQSACTPAIANVTGLGTGVATALAVAVGSAGSPVVNGGALGTPSSGTATNLTALNATQLTTGTLPAARTNGHMNGTATNDAAAAGEIGELVQATCTSVALTTATAANCTSIPLTAGDWEIMAVIRFAGAGATTSTDWASIISSTSTPSVSGANSITGFAYADRLPSAVDQARMFTHMPYRISLAAPTTYYLHAQASFAASTYSIVNGILRARRVR